ncbi:MAG: L,D-transpeptidase family protein, partial [Nocardia sp.]|nr:L,D-transpeptidase family protein [Nocardia sp.]
MSTRRCRFGVALGIFLMTMLMAACSSAPGPGADQAPHGTPGPAAPAITMNPAPGSHNVDPLGAIEVNAADGLLTDVSLTNEEGKPVPGTLNSEKTAWKPNTPLGYGHTYTMTAKGLTVTGISGPFTSTFDTLTPSNQVKTYLNTTGSAPLADGGTYGVGTVIVAHFDEAVDKAEAQKHLSVTTDPPVPGSWYWLDDQNAHWRPEKYWAPGTKVTVASNIFGAQVGPGLYGQEDSKTSFTIGPAHVSIADDNTKQVQVFENSKLIRTMPTSMGRGGSEDVGGKTIYFNTPAGIYTVMGKGNPVIMDSSSYGLPVNTRLGYKETIGWATQISADGIYLHQLDATVWAQGNTDTTHGCLNLNLDNSSWFYNYSLPGDVVE